MNGSNDLRRESRRSPRNLVRFGVGLVTAMLALGVAPSMASAQTADAVKRTTFAAVQPAVAQQAGLAAASGGVVYQVRCYGWGCDVSFSTTWRYDRARLWVGCSNGSGVYSATWYGPGGGYLSASCAAYGFGSPTQYWFSYWNSDPWFCSNHPGACYATRRGNPE